MTRPTAIQWSPGRSTLTERISAGSLALRQNTPYALSSTICGETAADPLTAMILLGFGIEELSKSDRVLAKRAERLQQFLTQPLFVAEAFTGRSGLHVPLADTLDGCERILNGEFDDQPTDSLYMIGAIDQQAQNGKGAQKSQKSPDKPAGEEGRKGDKSQEKRKK